MPSDLTIGACDEGISAISFRTHLEDYKAYFSEAALRHARLVLFDGYILPHGLPSGSRSLDYEYGRHDDKYNQFAVKLITWQEDKATVCSSGSEGGELVHLHERSLGDKPRIIRATVVRQLLLIPKGHVAFGFRVKPRSLERQYTMIDVQENQVVFRTASK